MATIKYKCDTCERTIELIENKKGLTTFGTCVITNNCRGILHPEERNPNNLRESLPKYAPELDDFIARKLFHTHTQETASKVWVVNHGLSPSSVTIVYGSDGSVIDPDLYTLTNSGGISRITFSTPQSGVVHMLSRSGGAVQLNTIQPTSDTVKCSYFDTLTFAVPKYITNYQSGSYPNAPPTVDYSPARNICNSTILLEIVVKRPNEEEIVCTEQLDALLPPSPWVGWGEILVRKRKQYCLRSKKISDLKIFKNTNDQSIVIPDGTTLKISRIAYSDIEVLTAVPDRGLLMLLADSPYGVQDKRLDALVDCGEMVDADLGYFIFRGGELYAFSDNIEQTYPNITKI